MKINFNIDINTDKAPQVPAIKKQGGYFYTSLSVITHLCLFGLLFSSALFANDIVIDEGDNSIKAVMVDLTQMAAPQQSLVENTPDIKGVEDSEIIDNKPIEEPPVEPVKEPEVVKEPEPVVDTPIPLPEKEVVEKKEPKPEPKPKPKPKQKPKPESKPTQRSSQQQVRQEAITQNIANTAVAPQISENRQYSGNPSPISRNQPEYPRRALDRHLEGYVIALFDINSNGRVENIRIIEAQPNNIFNRSVINAMKTWKYKPIVAKNLKIKIVFNLDRTIKLN